MTGVAVLEKPQEIEDFSGFARTIFESKYSWKDESGQAIETWSDTAWRVVTNVLGALGYTEQDEEVQTLYELVNKKKFVPGGRYLYATGREMHQTNNCFLYRAEDSREGWSRLQEKTDMALMTGGGIGVDYSDVRHYGAKINKTGGFSTGPLALMQMVNESGRQIMQGGARRSAIWAGLNWQHPDVEEFIQIKDWPQWMHEAIQKRDDGDPDYKYFAAPMEMTNVSVLLDDEFFIAYQNENHPKHHEAHRIYKLTVSHMVRHGEPGFSIDIGLNKGETLRNACTEITSSDDSDVCNLGSINLARIRDLEELEEVIEYATLFLLAGTVYSDVPHEEVEGTRQRNRRLGLGLMGLHEWLLKRGYRYEPNAELAEWLTVYADQTDQRAKEWAKIHNLSVPVKTRAIAPTGTIGIIAETTTGIEPIFCVAYKRRYMSDGASWQYQYVIDPTAERLIREGVDPDTIEDAYMLSLDVERRLAFQAFVQGYVDHAISGTINLPYPIVEQDELNDFCAILYEYLPRLRGITVYPDGSRGGQPLTVASYYEAKNNRGIIFEDDAKCIGGVCGA